MALECFAPSDWSFGLSQIFHLEANIGSFSAKLKLQNSSRDSSFHLLAPHSNSPTSRRTLFFDDQAIFETYRMAKKGAKTRTVITILRLIIKYFIMINDQYNVIIIQKLLISNLKF